MGCPQKIFTMRRSIACLLCISTAFAFGGFSRFYGKQASSSTSTALSAAAPNESSRRHWLAQVTATACATAAIVSMPGMVSADDEEVLEMKTFVDPQGYFAINVPRSYYVLRRTQKGDLPDPSSGQGRRGSSIFTAGNMAKAEVVAIERFPTRVLLEENGIDPTGDLSTFPGVGEAGAVANLIIQRRERDKAGTQMRTTIVPNSLALSDDGLTLYFSLKSEIDVQKPDLLLEQTGFSDLFRITMAKASLASKDGNIMAVFASALEQDFNGPDGAALKESVASFTVTDQSNNA